MAKTHAEFRLDHNSYGKSRVRMMKVSREGKRHTVRELSVDVSLQGDFEDVHLCGDNSKCLPTDTMKNAVYALGKDDAIEAVETFAVRLARHFVERNAHVRVARIGVTEMGWNRLTLRGREHPHCFEQGTAERQSCSASLVREGRKTMRFVTGQLANLVLLKSTDSAFAGFMRDEYTTLPETDDRIMATSVSATWVFGRERADYAKARTQVRSALVETFARHKSKSVQHTLYAMGEAALKRCGAIDRIDLSLPNKHCLLVNLSPFGMDNRNEVFVPTDEPHGLIEAAVVRAVRE